MNIVYSSSDAYSECTGISLYSLLQNNKHIDELNIYILDTDITRENREKIQKVANKFNRTIKFIPAKDGFQTGAENLHLPLMRGSYNTYSRVLLNTWFSNLDKILVIDSDTLVSGDVSGLWDVDLKGKLIGAVPEVAMYGKINHLENPELLKSIPMYYNMGICIVNLKEWRKKDIDTLIKERIDKEKPELMIADQSIINMYLNEFITRIHLKYNYYSVVHGIKYKTLLSVFPRKRVFEKIEFESANANPSIIHYFGHSFERPWFRHNAAYLKSKYISIRAETPWKESALQKWKKADSKVIRMYDLFCYFLLKIHARSFCLKFRYYYGQLFKEKLGIER